MASDKKYLDFNVDQIENAGQITYIKNVWRIWNIFRW